MRFPCSASTSAANSELSVTILMRPFLVSLFTGQVSIDHTHGDISIRYFRPRCKKKKKRNLEDGSNLREENNKSKKITAFFSFALFFVPPWFEKVFFCVIFMSTFRRRLQIRAVQVSISAHVVVALFLLLLLLFFFFFFFL